MTKSLIIKEFSYLFILLFCAFVVALDPNLSNAVLDGVNLFIACVFPALFPYLIITAFFGKITLIKRGAKFFSPLSKKIFKTNGIVFYAYFVSILSGYPLGSKTVADLKKSGLLTNEESVRASCLCSTSSPVFLIGCVGNLMFRNTLFGVIAFLVHLLSSLTIGFLFSFYKDKNTTSENFDNSLKIETGDFFTKSMNDALSSILFVGGVITLFYLITEMLVSYKLLSPVSYLFKFIFNNETLGEGLTYGIFECTKGLKTLATCDITRFTLPIVASVSGFGGLSVIMQSLPFLKDAKIKTAPFLLSKTVAVIVNFIYGLIFSFILF